jgi:hypothetical protein
MNYQLHAYRINETDAPKLVVLGIVFLPIPAVLDMVIDAGYLARPWADDICWADSVKHWRVLSIIVAADKEHAGYDAKLIVSPIARDAKELP